MVVTKRNKMSLTGGLACVLFAFFMSSAASAKENLDLNLWVCPAGGYEENENVQQLADDYQRENPGVSIAVKILDKETAADEITSVLGTADAPDLILGAPEDIVTRWGADGYMADLGELWDERTIGEIDGEIRETCAGSDGIYYEMPVFRDVYTMAINYDVFRESGVLQYLNEEVHSWKDSGFIDCILVLHEYALNHGGEDISAVKIPCADKADQRYFMSFITNLSNGSLINDTRTAYKVNSSSIRNSFSILNNMIGKGVQYEPEMTSDEEQEEFLSGQLPVTFFWSWYRHQKYAFDADFTLFPMMYPNSKNRPALTGDICGFGVVDSHDELRTGEAIRFVRFVTEDPDEYRRAVELSSCFPVRTRVGGKYVQGLYSNDEDCRLFRFFMDYYNDYVPVMPLFDELEEEWPQMLRQIAQGGKVKQLSSAINEKLNQELEEKYGITAVEME